MVKAGRQVCLELGNGLGRWKVVGWKTTRGGGWVGTMGGLLKVVR